MKLIARTLNLVLLGSLATSCGKGLYSSSPRDNSLASSELYFYVGHSESMAISGKGLKGAKYSVSPTLPEGLRIDSDLGALVGAPTQSSAKTEYTVNVTSDFGESQFTFMLKVLPSVTSPLLLQNINPVGSANPVPMAALDEIVVFSATSVAAGAELWKSDGTSAGTSLVKDIDLGATSSSPSALVTRNNANPFTTEIIFSAVTASGSELWKSDGTNAGTVQIADFEAGPGSGTFSEIARLGTAFIVGAGNGIFGEEPTLINAALTSMTNLLDISTGASDSLPNFFTTVGDQVFFFASDFAVYGAELHVTDGTASGTVLVKDINPGLGDSVSSNAPVATGGRLYFSADDGSHGQELWKSDGTSAGTVLVKDIQTGAGGSDPEFFAVHKGLVYFAADDGINGIELWRSDGTSAGTYMVKNINAAGGASVANLTSSGSYLYFVADDGTNGAELWRTDGTSAGTLMVKDIDSGAGSSSPENLTDVNGTLFFTATTVGTGRELYKTNGTATGTTLVSDLQPGAGDGIDSSARLLSWQGQLFFPAAAAPGDIELYTVAPY